MSELLYCIESIEDYKKQEVKILEEEIKSGKHNDKIIEMAKNFFIGYIAFISGCKTGRKIGDEGYDGNAVCIDESTINDLLGKYSHVFKDILTCDNIYANEELAMPLNLYNNTVTYNFIKEDNEYYDEYTYSTVYESDARFKCLVPYFEKIFKDNFIEIFKGALDNHGYFKMIASDFEFKNIFDRLIDEVINEENLDISLEEIFDVDFADIKLKVIDKYINEIQLKYLEEVQL